MIPHTFPSVLINNQIKMVVYVLSDITGLTRWVDYIPVKPPTTINSSFANTFEAQGYQLVEGLTNLTGKTSWIDYIPVYIDYSATIPFSTDANGYIPMDAFSVIQLFASGEQGVWYDPSDFSTMFQDAAGTIPVTAVGQAVGRILDKSGRGNHATQSTSTKRPVLQQDANGKYYLLFDGIDDALQTASINFTGTDKVTVWAGVRKLSDAASGELVELSINASINNGCFVLLAPGTDGAHSYRIFSRGTVAPVTSAGTGPFAAAPDTAVITAIGGITPAVQTIRRNAAQVETTSSSQGTGNYGNHPLYIGSRAGTSRFFNGRLYSLIIRGAQSTDTQITNTEAYVNSRTGAY